MKKLLIAVLVLLPTILYAQNNISSYWVTGDGEAVKKTDIDHWTSHGTNLNWDGDTVRLYAARNEIVAFQLHLKTHATNAVNQLDVFLDTLAMGSTRISNGGWSGDIFDYINRRIEIFTVAYTDSMKFRCRCSGTSMTCYGKPISPDITWTSSTHIDNQYIDSAFTGYMPWGLIPKEATVKGLQTRYGGTPMNIAPNRIQSLWFDVYVPRTQTIGYYTGRIRITQQSILTHVIPVKLQVLNATISDTVFLPTWGALNADFTRRYNSVGDQISNQSGGPQFWTMMDKYMKFFHRHLLGLSPNMVPDTFRAHMVGYFTGAKFGTTNNYDGPGKDRGQRLYSIGTYDQGGPAYRYGIDDSARYGDGYSSGFDNDNDGGTGWQTAANKWAQILVDSSMDTSRTGYYSFFKYLIDEPRNVWDARPGRVKADWLKNNGGIGQIIGSFNTAYAMDYGDGQYTSQKYISGYLNPSLTWIGMAGSPGWGGNIEASFPDTGAFYGRLGWIRAAVTYWRSQGKRMMITSGGWPSMGQYQQIQMPMVAAMITPWIAMLYPVDAVFLWHTDYLPHEVGWNDNKFRDYWKGTDYDLNSGGLEAFSITNASNATPIVLTLNEEEYKWTTGVVNLVTGNEIREVWVGGVTGNTAANGKRWIKRDGVSNRVILYSNSAATSPVAGNGSYTGGGVVRPWEGSGQHGTGTIVLSGEDKIYGTSDKGVAGPIATVNMKLLRRGQQDYQLFWQARRSLGWNAIKTDIWNVMPTAADSITNSYTSATRDYPDYSLRGDEYAYARLSMLQKLAGTTGAIPPSITTYSVTPESAIDSATVTITYAVQNADSVLLNGVKLASASGATIYQSIITTTIFTLVAYGDGMTDSDSKTIYISYGSGSLTPELIVNGSFERTGGWLYAATDGIGNTWTRETVGALDSTWYWKWITGSTPGTYNQTYQSSSNVFAMIAGSSYRLKFSIYNETKDGSIRVRILNYPAYTPIVFDKIFSFDAGVQLDVDTVWTCGTTNTSLYLQFLGSFGAGTNYLPVSGTTKLDGISLKQETPDNLGAPVISYPLNAATDVDTPLTATWSSIGGATSYDVQLDDSATFTSVILIKDTVTETSYYFNTLEPGTEYTLRVRALSGSGNSSWSDLSTFTTISTAPGSAPTLYQPPNKAKALTLTQNFIWSAIDNATEYQIQLSSNASFTDTLKEFSSNTNSYRYGVDYTSEQVFLDWTTSYFWRVRATNSQGVSDWSNVFQFRTGSRRGVRTDKML